MRVFQERMNLIASPLINDLLLHFLIFRVRLLPLNTLIKFFLPLPSFKIWYWATFSQSICKDWKLQVTNFWFHKNLSFSALFIWYWWIIDDWLYPCAILRKKCSVIKICIFYIFIKALISMLNECWIKQLWVIIFCVSENL